MIIARWTINARFGHKQEALNLLKSWNKNIGSQVGWTDANTRIITGSVGALESTIESEVSLADMGALHDSFEKLGGIPDHQAWSKELEPHIVSGTSHWQVLRVV